MMTTQELPEVPASPLKARSMRIGAKGALPGVPLENPPERFLTCTFLALVFG